MSRTGIFGGTFNPIHSGHIKIAGEAHRSLKLDRVLMIPSGISYFKAGQYIPDGRVRYEMCCLACGGNPFLEVSDVEIKREGNSYTCETLKILREDFPDDEFFYILGADSLAQVRDFKNPEEIFRLCQIAVSVREGYDNKELDEMISFYEKRFQADITVFNSENINISSSMIRERVKGGQGIKGLVPESVEEYIINNKLYL